MWSMDKAEHGRKLAAAMAGQRADRQFVADALDVTVRTVTNWSTGKTMPDAGQRVVLRRVLGDYDNPGDPVEIAVRGSGLTEWRQDAVLSTYKRHLHEQRGEAAG